MSRIGVLLVAFEAESTLAGVLDRIPDATQLQLAEVLVHDDHSTDDTHGVAQEYHGSNPRFHLTVVRHPHNLGYGGNQKAGYMYAINHGWDVVVLLHGDGQYAPEIMGDIIDPIVNGDADAVFGSRMMHRGGAREGGMPLYKYVGNRILTTTQNTLTGLQLSEWHSGYRAYRVSALAGMPFAGMPDGFSFDTEIILQLAATKSKIVEVPIPTYYGDEICRVNGVKYAVQCLAACWKHRRRRRRVGSRVLALARAAALAVSIPSASAPPAPVVWADFPANTIPAPAIPSASAPPAPVAVVWSADQVDPGLIATPAGCHTTATGAGLNGLVRGPIGPIKGFDSPRLVRVPDGRTLWLLQDAFLDYDTTPSSMLEMKYINNALLVQDQVGCFTAIAHGDRVHAESFEPGTRPADTWLQFWWPAAASAASGQLQIIWIEMTHDPTGNRNPLDGPAVHPTGVWLGVYDLDTFERLSFNPHPHTPDVHPIWGFDAVDDPTAGYTYLFGNTFLQNLALDPVPAFGSHSATATWLARVPLGRLDTMPEFWDGADWTADQNHARPIAKAGNVEHIMHPQMIDGQWWSTTKPEGFLGAEVIAETAPAPQGPWTIWGTVTPVAHTPDPGVTIITYAPVLAPWRSPAGEPIVILSQIDPAWGLNAGGDPTRYRPQAFTVP